MKFYVEVSGRLDNDGAVYLLCKDREEAESELLRLSEAIGAPDKEGKYLRTPDRKVWLRVCWEPQETFTPSLIEFAARLRRLP